MSGSSDIPSTRDLRSICRTAKSATLATIATDHKQVSDGWPVASMVVPAMDIDGSPILLISDLADHTRHIRADNRVSLLFTPSRTGPGQTGPDHTRPDQTRPGQATGLETDSARMTIFGRAVRDVSDATRICYLRAHPEAGQYAGFPDFAFYRIAVDALYWVGGFGKQRRLKGDKFIVQECHPLVSGHDGILRHMNADHLDALQDIVGHFTAYDPAAGWKMHSMDCDGMVLTSDTPGMAPVRIDFARTIQTPGDARDILVEMCKKSRA